MECFMLIKTAQLKQTMHLTITNISLYCLQAHSLKTEAKAVKMWELIKGNNSTIMEVT